MIIDDLRTSYRDNNELRDAAINQRRGLVGLAGQYGCHCRFGNRLLQSFEASLHLRLHRHDLDRMYPGQNFGDKVILPIVLRGACIEYLPEFARTTDSESSKEKEQDRRDQHHPYKRQIDRNQSCLTAVVVGQCCRGGIAANVYRGGIALKCAVGSSKEA